MAGVKAEKVKAEMQEAFTAMWMEMYEWRSENPGASFDEIAAQVTPKRRALMGRMISQLAMQHGDGEVVAGLNCRECGAEMIYKGKSKREVEHLEGESELKRAYYHCAQCERGLFPPG